MESRVKGLAFSQVAIALAVTKNNLLGASAYAVERWGAPSAPASILQRAVAAAGLNEQSLPFRSAATEFFSAVSERSLLGRLPLRRVPNAVRLLGIATGSTAYWAAEGKAKPVSKPTFTPTNLRPKKVVALSIFTNELMESTDVFSESLIRRDMISALAGLINATFISDSAGDEATPSGILEGVAPLPASAVPADDIRTLVENFAGDLERAHWVMSPTAASKLSGSDHLDAGLNGGSLLGLPLHTSTGALSRGVLLDPDQIALVEAGTNVSTSSQGAIEMSEAPTGDSTAPVATNQVSLWEANSTAILSEAQTNWQRVSDAAVTWMDAAWALQGT
jgi:hypothetical protein